jgi:hypothetical protein
VDITKCGICNRKIDVHEKLVRVVVELVSRGGEKDSLDSQYWTDIKDWELLAACHLKCARERLEAGEEISYGQEIDMLPLSEYDSGPKRPVLKLVNSK